MKFLKHGLRVAVALLLLGFVASQVDWRRLVEVAARAKPAWLAAAFGVSTLDRLFMAAKWRYLLRGLGVQITTREAIVHYYMGGLVGAALQWHLSGDIARAVGLGRRTNRHSGVAASVVLEKLAGLQALMVLAAGSGMLLNARLDFVAWPSAIALAGMAVLLAGVGPFLVRFAGIRRFVVERLQSWGKTEPLATALRTLPSQLDQNFRGLYGRFVGLTFLEQLVPTLLLLIYIQAFSVELGLLEVLSVLPIITLLARLPISVESLGVMEGLFVYFLGLVGVGTATAFLLALVSRFMDMVVMGLGAFACSLMPEWSTARSATSRPER